VNFKGEAIVVPSRGDEELNVEFFPEVATWWPA